MRENSLLSPEGAIHRFIAAHYTREMRIGAYEVWHLDSSADHRDP